MLAAATTRPTAMPPSIFMPPDIPSSRADPPEGWGWCYLHQIFLDLSDRATAQLGPIPHYV
jgi:hypothetical protein